MTTLKNKIEYKKGEIISILRDINEFVVSLDRIGSLYHDFGEEEVKKALYEYIFDKEVGPRLSNIRAILSTPFSDKLGEDDMDELEREMQDVKHWSFKEYKNKKL